MTVTTPITANADERELIERLLRPRQERRRAPGRGLPFENDQRTRRKDGQDRWFLIPYNPLRDDQGSKTESTRSASELATRTGTDHST